MKKYKCGQCGYIYEPDEGEPGNGYPPGTAFESLPPEYFCPECGIGKDSFKPV
jgi:rubredoxin